MRAPLIRFLGTVLLFGGLHYSGPALAGGCLVEDPGHFFTADGGCFDTASMLVWSDHAPAASYNFAASAAYCAFLDQDGFGWRRATVKELQKFYNHATARDFFTYELIARNDPGFTTWTADDAGGPNAWRFWLTPGAAEKKREDNLYSMICVRALGL